MRIIVFSEYFPDSKNSDITGGVEARTYNIAKILAKKHQICVITSWRKGLKRKDNFSNIDIIRVGPNHNYSNQAGFFSRIIFAAAAINEGMRLAKKFQADIITGENFTTYFPAYYVAGISKKPCVITYHETWAGDWVKNKGIVTGVPYELYERMLLILNYDKIISVSNFTKERLVMNNVAPDKIKVIHNGINAEEFAFPCKKERKPTICFIGRLVETKKADVLIRAVAILKKDIPDIRCRIIGQGIEKAKLEKLASEIGVKNNVSFLGYLKESTEVKRLLKSSTLFCLPSVAEGFGIVLLEAMASGTPYVCTGIDALREVTQNGKGGMIFKKNDEHDLAERMSTLLRDKGQYSEKVEEGKALCRKYAWEDISAAVENLYKQAINDYGRYRKKVVS
jgi:glycosyltransferase involved in cell wall biosynthesis